MSHDKMKLGPIVYNSRKHKSTFRAISLLWKCFLRNWNYSYKRGRDLSDKTEYPGSNSMNTSMFKTTSECKTFIHMFIRTGGVLINFHRVVNPGHAHLKLSVLRTPRLN